MPATEAALRLSPRGAADRSFALAWRATYEACYACFRAIVLLVCRPLFLVRSVGRRPRLPEGGVILCPNHQSYLDPAFVQLTLRRRVTFVMTDRFHGFPPAKLFFLLVGAIPIGAGRKSWGGMRRAVALLRLGGALVVFPEGKLSRDGTLHRAQRGIATVARRGRAPVVPVAIEGSLRAWPKGARWMRRSDVRLAYGEPIAWEGEATREREQAFADRILAGVESLRATIRRRSGERP